ncbi:hypothetical protein L3Q82_008479, partial [Scortum barcoo]
RQQYWVPSANAAIRKLVAKCVVCRRLSGSRGEQHMADLPIDRVTPDHPPFTNVGVDFFRPFEVKCSLQGEVKLMRSDNGTNLIRAEGELMDALKELDVHIKDTLLKKGITWAFNPPQVPTMVAYGRDKS